MMGLRFFVKFADDGQGSAESGNDSPFASEFTARLLKSCISFRDTTAGSPAWERCRSSELPWWKALTEGFMRCRFHVETTDRKLEEALAWFSQAMGPALAALYCAVGPEWITNVIQAGSSRWKPQHYQWMKKPKPKRPYLLKST